MPCCVQVPPPNPADRPHTVHLGLPGVTKEDPLFWLRDDARKDPDVLQHLRNENAFSAAETAALQPLREELFASALSRLQEDDTSAPNRRGDWLYFTRTEKGKAYKIHCRRVAAAADGAAQQFLDENVVAGDNDYVTVGAVRPAPAHDRVLFTVDTKGDEVYEVRLRAVPAGVDGVDGADDVVELRNTSGSVRWGADGSTLYYTTRDAAHRPHRVWRHTIGTPQSDDTMLLEEADELFVRRCCACVFWGEAFCCHVLSCMLGRRLLRS